MPFEHQSLTRRTLSPTLASVVIGIAVGIVAVYGLVAFSDPDQAATTQQVESDSALLGGAEYGTRN